MLLYIFPKGQRSCVDTMSSHTSWEALIIHYFKFSSLSCITSFLFSCVCFGHLPRMSGDSSLPGYVSKGSSQKVAGNSQCVNEAWQPEASPSGTSRVHCGELFPLGKSPHTLIPVHNCWHSVNDAREGCPARSRSCRVSFRTRFYPCITPHTRVVPETSKTRALSV